MQLMLRDYVLDEQLVIPMKDELIEAISLQWSRCDSPEAQSEWANKLRVALEPAITAALDWDLRPPSKAQIEYALAIAKALKVSLPGEALQFQGTMRDFLDRFAQFHKAKAIRQGLGSEKLD